MAVIVKSDIVAAVDANLQTNFATTAPNGLDRAIVAVLNDMSKRGLLVSKDDTQTLVDGGLTLAYPTGFRQAISITLIDGDGNTSRPLKKLPGGHAGYRKLRHNNTATGFTREYSLFNNLIYLWKPASQAYTTLIEYRKNHAKDADNIEFTTEFENLMFAGATFWHAAAIGRSNGIAIWGPIYQDELRWAMLNRNVQPSIIGA